MNVSEPARTFWKWTEADREEWGREEMATRLREVEKVKSGDLALQDAQRNARSRRDAVGATDSDAFTYIRA